MLGSGTVSTRWRCSGGGGSRAERIQMFDGSGRVERTVVQIESTTRFFSNSFAGASSDKEDPPFHADSSPASPVKPTHHNEQHEKGRDSNGGSYNGNGGGGAAGEQWW